MSGLKCDLTRNYFVYTKIMLHIVICFSFLDQLPYTGYPKIMAIYFLTVLEVKTLKLWNGQRHAFYQDSRKESFLASLTFWCL
jgi:hypothetical protein